jgi:hypothetical protein
MAEPVVWTFFYGSYLNRGVLAEVDLHPDRWEVASLSGFDITIAPLANLRRSERDDVLGGTYLPEAVLTRTADGTFRPALCYLAPAMATRPADPAYGIVGPAREMGFPDWYVLRLESFRP